MDTRRLTSFIAVAECGSVSEASRRLHIAQPALSRQLRLLERDAGAVLFVRTVKGVMLTEAGERLFPHALAILRQLDAVPDVARNRDTEISGRVAIGLPTTASAVLSKPLLLALRREYPEIHVHLVESLSGYLRKWVQIGVLDLSLLYDPEPDPHLHLEGILIEELTLAGASEAFRTDLDHIRLRDLHRYPLVLPSSSHSLRRLLESVALSHGVKLKIVLDVDSLVVMKAILRDGDLFSVLAPAAISEEIASGKLRSIKIIEPELSRSVSLATSTIRGQTRACDAVRRLALRVARDLLAGGIWKGRPVTVLEGPRQI